MATDIYIYSSIEQGDGLGKSGHVLRCHWSRLLVDQHITNTDNRRSGLLRRTSIRGGITKRSARAGCLLALERLRGVLMQPEGAFREEPPYRVPQA